MSQDRELKDRVSKWLRFTQPWRDALVELEAKAYSPRIVLDQDRRVVSIENAATPEIERLKKELFAAFPAPAIPQEYAADFVPRAAKQSTSFTVGKWITESDLAAFEGGVATIRPKISYRSLDAGSRTSDAQWSSAVRARIASGLDCEPLPLP